MSHLESQHSILQVRFLYYYEKIDGIYWQATDILYEHNIRN